jgi:hypothetical protein
LILFLGASYFQYWRWHGSEIDIKIIIRRNDSEIIGCFFPLSVNNFYKIQGVPDLVLHYIWGGQLKLVWELHFDKRLTLGKDCEQALKISKVLCRFFRYFFNTIWITVSAVNLGHFEQFYFVLNYQYFSVKYVTFQFGSVI